MPDVRRAIAYLTLLASIHRREYPGDSPWQVVVQAVGQLNAQVPILHGFEIGNDGLWRRTTASERSPLVMHALFFTAACSLYFRGVVAARIGHGTHTLFLLVVGTSMR